MTGLDVVERGYRAVAAGDRTTLAGVFVEDAVWQLMNRAEVVRTFEGREAIVGFLLRFHELRLEAITQVGEAVIAAHSFVTRMGHERSRPRITSCATGSWHAPTAQT